MFQQDSDPIKTDFNIKSLIDNLDDTNQDYNNSLTDFLKEENSLLINTLSRDSSVSATPNLRSLEDNNNTLGTFASSSFDLHSVDMSQLDLPRVISDFTNGQSSAESSINLDAGLGFRTTSFPSALDSSQSLSAWDRSMENVFKSDSYSSSLNVAAKQFKPVGLTPPVDTSVSTPHSLQATEKTVSAMSMSVQDYESAFLDYRSAQGTHNPAYEHSYDACGIIRQATYT